MNYGASSTTIAIVDYPTTLVNAVDGGRSYGRGRSGGPQGRGRGNGKICTYYSKIGHTVETCYKKHGFSLNFGRDNNYAANYIEVELWDEKGATSSSSRAEEKVVTLTKDQYQSLMALLEKKQLLILDAHQMQLKRILGRKTPCDICHMARQKGLSFSINNHNAISVFDLVHIDIRGHFSTKSINGFRYFLTILDYQSRNVWIVMLKSKSKVPSRVQNFVALVENQFGKFVKNIRSDNGPEFLLTEIYSMKGIIHQRSCVSTPQQNGRVEIRHQHILSISRALMFQSKLPKTYWSCSVQHVVFLMNRILTGLLGNNSSYEHTIQDIKPAFYTPYPPALTEPASSPLPPIDTPTNSSSPNQLFFT
ncbi:uncharacterized protein [Cicer arietinum]|uniref:uncharacterized protein n=1 Tax=Cicer arietinum TaxID=3827 RepID=UPI003CC57835